MQDVSGGGGGGGVAGVAFTARIRVTFCLDNPPLPDGQLLDEFEAALQVRSEFFIAV